jgi:addiction module RelE/StbE family toxin
MQTLVWNESFRRAFKRLVRKNPGIQEKVLSALATLESDLFAPSLKAHKLQGDLKGLWACSVEYDCRIIFEFKQDKASSKEFIFLVNIGSHDEVY